MTLDRDDVRRATLAAGRQLPSLLVTDDPDKRPGYDNTAVLQALGDGRWRTGWFERGRLHDERVQPDEDAACRDFLAMLGLPVPDEG